MNVNNWQKNQADWDATYDANTLSRAEQIKMDTPRLKKAQGAAKKMVKEREDHLKAMEKIAKGATAK